MSRFAAANLAAALVAASVASASNETGAGGPRRPGHELTINSAIVDEATRLITIRGENFGDQPPDVTLAEAPLVVVDASPEELLAVLPAGTAPGTYRLTVSKGHGHGKSDDFELTIGAAGAPGPPGPPGDPGRPGPPGPQGLPGDSVTLRLASLGIDPEPFLGAVAALRPADCAAGSALSLTAGGGAVGEVLAVVGAEAISEPFRFLVAVRSPTPPDPTALLGSSAQLGMTIGGASTAVSGILTEVRVGASPQGEGLLLMTLEPNLARLARGSGFSVHQGMSAPDLVGELLQAAGVPYEDRTSVPYRVLEFQARYGESFLAFASRVLENEGIHYHFEGDTTVLADTNTDFPPAGPALTYAGDGGPGTLGRFARGRGLVPTQATVRGFNFVTPGQLIQGSAGGPGDAEIYVFSSAVTSLGAAQRDANRRLEGASAEGQRHTGASGLPTPRAGSVITVVDTLGGAFGGAYLVTAARHVGLLDPREGCFSFGNEFSAIPSATPFRPPRVTPVPNVGGPVSAVVTGPAGTTVFRDQHGRVKLSFRFDRDSQNDENSSAWVRVGVPAGHTGEPFVPLVGSEALVAFIEGDPSQPVVIGSLNNPEDPPPPSP